MAIDFSHVNLEVVDISTNFAPELFINQSGVTFSKRILEDLGYPQYVQYSTDPAQSIFAIRACKGTEAKAATFSKGKGEQNGTLSTSNKTLHDVMAALIPDFQLKTRYRVIGELDTVNRIMYYDMKTAEICPSRQVNE